MQEVASPVVAFAVMQHQSRYAWSLPDRSHTDKSALKFCKAQGILARTACLDIIKARYSLDMPTFGHVHGLQRAI